MSKKTNKKILKPAARKTAAKSKARTKAVPTAAKKSTAAKAPPAKKIPVKARSTKPAAGKKSSVASTSPAGTNSIPAVGDMAPAFELPRDGGGRASLADYAGRKLVIFFYPRADTPGCTKEAIDFTRLSADFAAAGTAIIGVSADPQHAQDAFRDKHELAMPLLSDETQQMLQAYKVWDEKSMYGRVFMGIVRTTLLVGADGRILQIWRNVKVDGHADEVLAAARKS